MSKIGNRLLYFSLNLALVIFLAGCKSGPTGNQFLDQGKYVEAAKYYEEQLSKKPDDPVLNNQLGYSYAKLGKSNKAIASYQKAIQIKPDYPEAHYNLGFLLMSRQMLKLDEAVQEFTKAIELKSDYDKAFNNRGMCYAYLGKFEQAKADLEKAISLSSQTQTYKDNLDWIKRMENVTKASLPKMKEQKEAAPQSGATVQEKKPAPVKNP